MYYGLNTADRFSYVNTRTYSVQKETELPPVWIIIEEVERFYYGVNENDEDSARIQPGCGLSEKWVTAPIKFH